MHDAFYLNTEIFTENLEKGIQKQKKMQSAEAMFLFIEFTQQQTFDHTK